VSVNLSVLPPSTSIKDRYKEPNCLAAPNIDPRLGAKATLSTLGLGGRSRLPAGNTQKIASEAVKNIYQHVG
jgi:hypothetical protein